MRHINKQIVIFTLVILVYLSCISITSIGSCQDNSNEGVWNVGDTWIYGTDYDGENHIVHTLKIIEADEEKYIMSINGTNPQMTSTVIFNKENLSEMSAEVNFYSDFSVEVSFSPGLQYLNLPLFVGKSWEVSPDADIDSTDDDNEGYPFQSDSLFYEFFVESTSTITVPAGEYDTYVILMNFSCNSDWYGNTYYYRIYYSDEVNNFVRWETVNSEEGQGLPLYPQYLYFGMNEGELKDTPLILLSYIPGSNNVIPLPIDDDDSDNLSDSWEIEYFGDLTQGPNDDPDEDDYNNSQEFEATSDPNDGLSIPGDVDGDSLPDT